MNASAAVSPQPYRSAQRGEPSAVPLQRSGTEPRTRDALDVALNDDDLLDEVALTVSFMLAANESPCRLSQEEIDRLLGVAH